MEGFQDARCKIWNLCNPAAFQDYQVMSVLLDVVQCQCFWIVSKLVVTLCKHFTSILFIWSVHFNTSAVVTWCIFNQPLYLWYDMCVERLCIFWIFKDTPIMMYLWGQTYKIVNENPRLKGTRLNLLHLWSSQKFPWVHLYAKELVLDIKGWLPGPRCAEWPVLPAWGGGDICTAWQSGTEHLQPRKPAQTHANTSLDACTLKHTAQLLLPGHICITSRTRTHAWGHTCTKIDTLTNDPQHL